MFHVYLCLAVLSVPVALRPPSGRGLTALLSYVIIIILLLLLLLLLLYQIYIAPLSYVHTFKSALHKIH